MKNPEYLDGLSFEAIGYDVWDAGNHQFPRPFCPARSAQMAVVKQHGYLTFDFIALFNGSHRIVLGDKVNDLVEVKQRLREPLQIHGLVFSA